MDSDHILYFKKVAELEHMTRAADELYVSRAHLSRSIDAIERELGVELFDRVGRGIRLNDAGRLFYQYACKFAADYSDVKTQMRQIAEKDMYQIALATNAAAYTPRLLARLARDYPQLTLRQSTAPRKSLKSMLRNRRVDFVITAPPFKDDDIECVTLLYEQIVAIFYDGHPFARRDTVSLSELSDERLIGVPVGYGLRDSVEVHCARLGVELAYSMETSDTGSLSQFVSNNLGIAIAPRSLMLQSEYFARNHVVFAENMPCPLCLAWRRGFAFSDVEEAFVATVRRYFEDELDVLLKNAPHALTLE